MHGLADRRYQYILIFVGAFVLLFSSSYWMPALFHLGGFGFNLLPDVAGLFLAAVSVGLLFIPDHLKKLDERRTLRTVIAVIICLAGLLAVVSDLVQKREDKIATKKERDDAQRERDRLMGQVTLLLNQQAILRGEQASAKRELSDMENQAVTLGAANLNQAKTIARLSKQNGDEVTDGDSFCYVQMGGVPGGLIATIHQSGKHPLSHIGVSITDQDAFQAALATQSVSNIASWRHALPVIDFLSRASLWHPLTAFTFAPEARVRNFAVEMFARNGAFWELIRIRRLADGGFTRAIIVNASYFDGKQGLVLEQVDSSFPRETLLNDVDWQNTARLRRINVASP